jgi:hypothetical protein
MRLNAHSAFSFNSLCHAMQDGAQRKPFDFSVLRVLSSGFPSNINCKRISSFVSDYLSGFSVDVDGFGGFFFCCFLGGLCLGL